MIDTAVLQEIAADKTRIAMKQDEKILDDALQVAIDAAHIAGRHMKAHLGTHIEKTKSTKDDLVTKVDKECQEMIESRIKTSFPTHDFLGEENVLPGAEASAQALEEMIAKEWLWIVDPIDGTTNFVHKRPASVVSIAAAHHGQVVVAVIYDPYRDELFSSRKGNGAHLNGAKLSVSSEETFGEALVGFGIGTKPTVRLPMLRCVAEFSNECRGIRLQGSAALELAWIASGRQTAFYELDLNSWDIAAGALLIQEAGGLTVDSFGQPFTLRTRHIVATNGSPKVQDEMLQRIAKAKAQTPN